MGTLYAAARRYIERSKLIPGTKHAADAKGRAETQFRRGNLTAQQKAHIDAMANGILGKGHHS